MADEATFQEELGGLEQSLAGWKNSKIRNYGRAQSAYEKAMETAKSGFDKKELLSKTLEEVGAGGIGLVEGGKGLYKMGKNIYNKFQSKKQNNIEQDAADNKEEVGGIEEEYDLTPEQLDIQMDPDIGVFEGVGSKAETAVNEIASGVQDLGETAVNSVKSAISNVGSKVQSFADETMSNLFDGAKGAVNNVKQFAKEVINPQELEQPMYDRMGVQGSSKEGGFGERSFNRTTGENEGIELQDMGTNKPKVYDQEGNELSNKDFDPSDTVDATDMELVGDEGAEETTNAVSDAVTAGTDTAIETGAEVTADAVEAVAAGSQFLDWVPFIGELTALFGLGATIVDGAVQAANAGKKYSQQQNAAEQQLQNAKNNIATLNPAGHYANASLNPLHNFQQ